MKILVLTSTYSRWKNDTEPKFVDNLCRYLARDSEIHVLAPHAPGTKTRERDGDVDVYRFRYCIERWETLAYDGGILPNLRGNKLLFLLVPFFVVSQLLQAIKLLREHEYDVIHAHWIIPQGLLAALARPFAKNKPAIVMTSHGGDLFALKGPLLSSIKRWITGRADKLTVVSSAMKARASELALKAEQDIAVIPMGVDSYGTFVPSERDADRKGLLFVGRLVDKKGIEYLLQAMPEVLAAFPNESLIIIGDGPLLEPLSEQCRSMGIDEQVHFLGPVINEQIPAYLQKSAITIFPSVVTENGDQEGTPVSIMEALACECAAVVSDYPGARDIISDRETGLLVEERSGKDIAAKIITLLEDPVLRKKLGSGGRSLVQSKYDWRVISREFSDIFQNVSSRDHDSAT